MAIKRQDIYLGIDPVGKQIADKVCTLVFNYTNGRIQVRSSLIDARDTNYRYGFYIDSKNKYMKKMPNQAEVQNLLNYITGIVDCMRSF
jgi:hypothetical protein